MRIVQWNPWRELDDLFSRIAAPSEPLERSSWLPAVDISETDEDYRIEVEIPAIAPENVDVSVRDGVLTISGERHSESESGQGKRHRVERRWGKFSRSFRLPVNVDQNAIEARSKDGVLYLTISKRENTQPRKIEVH